MRQNLPHHLECFIFSNYLCQSYFKWIYQSLCILSKKETEWLMNFSKKYSCLADKFQHSCFMAKALNSSEIRDKSGMNQSLKEVEELHNAPSYSFMLSCEICRVNAWTNASLGAPDIILQSMSFVVLRFS